MEQEVSAEEGINPVLKMNLTTIPKLDQEPRCQRERHALDLGVFISRLYNFSE